MSTYLHPMSYAVRERIGLPDGPEPSHGPARVAHVHLWVENGYDGTRSPAIADLPDCINRAIRELAEELGTTIKGSYYFPASQVFMPITQRDDKVGEAHLNVTWKKCGGGKFCPNATAEWL